ncbi:MAG: hypothetical protein HY529_03185 [Chloroflexi bacterium]|nr:hypothetical protein [Chloroflexota bacterium]
MEAKEIRSDLPPPCPVHKVGDNFVVNNVTCEGKIYHGVLVKQATRLRALTNGLPSANVIYYKCPDQGRVVYEIRRDPERWYNDAIPPLTNALMNTSGPLV